MSHLETSVSSAESLESAAQVLWLPLHADGSIGLPTWQDPTAGPAAQGGDTQGGEGGGAQPQGGGSVTRGQANEQQNSDTAETQQKDSNGQPGSPCGSDSSMYVFLALPLLIYFMIIRPQQKQEKSRKAMQAAVQKGTKVVLVSGMHGTVQSINDETVTIRVDGDLKLKFDRSSIARVESGEAAAPDSSDAKS